MGKEVFVVSMTFFRARSYRKKGSFFALFR